MITKVIFNIDTKLKGAAMKKARSEGMSLSAFLNIATSAYVNNSLKIDALALDIERAREDVRQGRTFSQKEVFRRFGLKLPR